MKKFYSLTLVTTLFITILSCQKEEQIPDIEATNIASTKQNIQSSVSSLVSLENIAGKNLSSIAKTNDKFKKAIESECLKQKNGDYEVKISDLLVNVKQQNLAATNQITALESIAKDMMAAKPGKQPVVFIPSVETFDPAILTGKSGNESQFEGVTARNENQVIFVFRDEPGKDKELFPGYVYDSSGNKKFYGMISEDFAWNNNVWVVGYEEFAENERVTSSMPFKQVEAAGPTTKATSNASVSNVCGRANGRAEYGGRIKAINISEMEPWTWGKLEMKYFVSTITGTLVKERAFYQTKRDDLEGKYHDYWDFIGPWDVNYWGQVTYERWIEEDSSTSTVTISTPVTPVPGGPTYTISATIRNEDDNLGLAGVYFTDPYYNAPIPCQSGSEYYISFMAFQRR